MAVRFGTLNFGEALHGLNTPFSAESNQNKKQARKSEVEIC